MIGLRIGGCRLEFHFGFAAAAAFLLLADRSGIGIAGAAAAILHELGHLVCMKWLGVPAVRIKCGIFGLEILEEKLPIEERLRAGEKYVAAGWNGSIKAKYQMLLEEYRRKQKE